MTTKVICRKCKKPNELTRIFCWHCSEKLDFSKLRKMRYLGSASPMSRFFQALRSILLLALVVVLGCVMWPLVPAGDPGEDADAQTAGRKLGAMDVAVDVNQSVRYAFSEAEANAYLQIIVDGPEQETESRYPRAGVREVNLAFTPHAITALIIAEWGPLHWTYEFEGVPVAESGSFRLDVTGVRVGHLPIPQPGWAYLAGRAGEMFRGLEREQRVLDHVDHFELGRGGIGMVLE